MIMNFKFKKLSLGLLLLLVFVLLSFSSFKLNPHFLPQKTLDYSGMNSLFVEQVDGLKFHWITNKKDVGSYELRDSDGTLISEGKTEVGRPHVISIDYKIKDFATFKFGGEQEGTYKIVLREKEKLKLATFKNVDSIFVVGDVHGRYNQLINLLQKSKVIDAELNWTAGNSSLVFLGDLFDRGDAVTKVLWFIYELEEKACKVGGKVHLVLGNHEIMVMSKDLRYLSRKEASIPIAHKTTYDYLFHPANSFLGSWLTSKPSVLKIDDVIFAHGGIVDLETNSIDTYNKQVTSQMKEPMFLDLMEEYPDSTKYSSESWYQMRYFFYREDGPFWFRGYVQSDTLAPQLKSMLKKYKSKVHVVAHTTQKTITERYGGKLLTTDLDDAATELLLMVRNKKKYKNFVINSEGEILKVKLVQ